MTLQHRISSLGHLACQFSATSYATQISATQAAELHWLWSPQQLARPSTPALASTPARRHNTTAAYPSSPAPLPLPAAASSPLDGGLDAATTLLAHSPLENPLALVLSPTQLGVQLWESAHAAAGLPWWLAIPVTTLVVRAALLPLSLRAYAASSNVALLHQAVGLSRSVTEAVEAAAQKSACQPAGQERRTESAAQGDVREAATVRPSGSDDDNSNGSGTVARSREDDCAAECGYARVDMRSLGRMELVRRVLAQLRADQGAPSFRWYLANAAVQVPLALTLTTALRRMCDSMWPGLAGEGALYFPDLTAPPLYLQTLSTPYGTAGAILPLALVLLYNTATDRSAGGSSAGISVALKLLVLPLYCAALLQPHAVLLYWLMLATSQLGVAAVAEALPPSMRRSMGLPSTGSTARWAANTGDSGVQLDELLRALAESYGKSGNKAAADSCLAALRARQAAPASANDPTAS